MIAISKWRPLSGLVVLTLWLAATSHSREEESLVLANGTRVKGSIEQYDERGIRLKHSTGQSTFYAHAEIASVHANESVAAVQGKRELARRNPASAVERFQSALATERREWALHQIRASLIKAFREMGKLDEAARIYLPLYDQRSDVEVLQLAPLVWSESQEVNDASKSQARAWLVHQNPMAKLLAASWLLKDSPTEALSALEDLTTDDPRIGWMARSQLWRAKGVDLDADELSRRKGLVKKMPAPIRAGPQFVLAESLERSGRHEEAALAYLWIPYVYAPGSDLAAMALLRAADASDTCGLQDEAKRIRREIVQAYPGTLWATRAESQLQESADKGKQNG